MAFYSSIPFFFLKSLTLFWDFLIFIDATQWAEAILFIKTEGKKIKKLKTKKIKYKCKETTKKFYFFLENENLGRVG